MWKKTNELAGGESDEAVVVEIEAQRVKAGDVNIETQVELVAVDEERARNVLLDDDWSLLRHVLPLVNHTDANASRRRRLNETNCKHK